MKEQLTILIKIQNIENEKDFIQKTLESIPEKLNVLDAEFAEFEKQLAAESADFDELKKTYRANESEVKSNLSKILKSKERLGMVKTNKEYQAILKEIEDIEKKNSDIEDIMLGYLEKIDGKEKNLNEIKKQETPIKDKIAKEREKILKEQQSSEKRLVKLESESKTFFEKAKPDFLDKYTKLRERVGNIVVVSVSHAVCSGCNMNIPAQLYNELHRFDTMRTCPFCRRIIYPDIEK